jgi:uncharacterized membrane protein
LKQGVEFVKTTLIGGLVAMVPLAVLGLLAATVVPIVIDVAEVLGEFLPFGSMANLLIAAIGGLLLLILICFLAGLALLTGPGDRLRQRVDSLLERVIPLYGAARRLAERVTGTEGDDFVPVTVDLHGTGARSLGLLIEKVPGGRCAVFIPTAPTAVLGSVFVVDQSRLERINAPMTQVFGTISEWGVGTAKLFPPDAAFAEASGPEEPSSEGSSG